MRATTGWRDDEYRGTALLDAGVGAGRFAERRPRKGREVFGVDLTTAVDAAYRNIGERENVHLVQADIFALPFRARHLRSRVLDWRPSSHARSSGRLCARRRTVKPRGRLAVYSTRDTVRRTTCRTPARWSPRGCRSDVMWALSAAADSALLPVSPAGRRQGDPPGAADFHESHWRWRWLDTFDWYTPNYQWQVSLPGSLPLVSRAGFNDVQIFDGPIRMSAEESHAMEPKQ